MSTLFCTLFDSPTWRQLAVGRRAWAHSLDGAYLPGGRAEDDDDWDECEFEPGVHEVWDPGSLDDQDDDSLPEAGDFWIEQDDEEAQVRTGRQRPHEC